jgi:hypothetical protein
MIIRYKLKSFLYGNIFKLKSICNIIHENVKIKTKLNKNYLILKINNNNYLSFINSYNNFMFFINYYYNYQHYYDTFKRIYEDYIQNNIIINIFINKFIFIYSIIYHHNKYFSLFLFWVKCLLLLFFEIIIYMHMVLQQPIYVLYYDIIYIYEN